MSILILTVIAALVPTAMSGVSASVASEIALFSSDSDSLSISGNGDNAKMELKATNDNGKSKRVSDFQLTADNVLNIKTDNKVDVIDNVDFTKAITTDVGNNQKVIGITSNGVLDFAGYNQGAYTLDVVVDDDRAYEATIVIGQQPPDVINKQVTKINNNQETRVQFELYPFPPDPPKCDEGEELIDGKCVPIYSCPAKQTDAEDKGCKPIEPICDEGEELVDGQCQLIPENPVEPYNLVPIEGEELDDPEEELDEAPEEEEGEEESGGSEDEVENDDDEEGGGESDESTDGEETDDSGETSE